jgi:hypothetical protein
LSCSGHVLLAQRIDSNGQVSRNPARGASTDRYYFFDHAFFLRERVVIYQRYRANDS